MFLIKKALTIDGEDKAVNHLLQGEYKLTNTSWSKLQKKYNLSKDRIYTALKGKKKTLRFAVPTDEEMCKKI